MPLHQRCDVSIPGTREQVTLPVTGDGAGGAIIGVPGMLTASLLILSLVMVVFGIRQSRSR